MMDNQYLSVGQDMLREDSIQRLSELVDEGLRYYGRLSSRSKNMLAFWQIELERLKVERAKTRRIS